MLQLLSRPLPLRRPRASHRSVLVCRASKCDENTDQAPLNRREALSTAAAAASVAVVVATTAMKPPPALATTPTSSSSSLALAPSAAAAPAPAAPKGRTLVVDPRGELSNEEAKRSDDASVSFSSFRTVEEAVSAARDGDVVALVSSDEVAEHSGRAVLSVPGVTLTTLGYRCDDDDESSDENAPSSSSSSAAERVAASAGPPPPPPPSSESRKKKRAVLRHETSRPYESTVVISAPRCRVIGIDVRHSSPSVANNYAVFVREEAAAADDSSPPLSPPLVAECDISSESGTAVGIESPARLSRCSLRGSNRGRFGAAVFAPGPPATAISRCQVFGGGGGGGVGVGGGGAKGKSGSLLVRNAEVFVEGSVFFDDLVLADGTGEFRACVLGKGARVERGSSWEGVEEFL